MKRQAVVGLANEAGGVGKTTTTLCLGHSLHRAGHRVCVVDSDPRMTATSIVGIPGFDDVSESNLPTLHDLLDQPEAGLAAAVVSTNWGFDLVPGARSLVARERSEDHEENYRLYEAVQAAQDYDFVLIDCPPNLGRITQAALLASSHIVLVTEATYTSLLGAGHFLQTVSGIQRVKARMNAPTEFTGVIVSQLKNTLEQNQHLQELRETFGDKVWDPPVPMSAAGEAVASRGVPPHEVLNRGTVARRLALAFDQLAGELVKATVV